MTKLISICFACYGNIFSEERMMIDMSDSSLKYSSWTTVKDICLSVHVNCNNTSSMIWRSPFSSFQLTNKRFSIQIFFSPQWYMSKVMDFNQHLLKIAWKWESPWHLIRRSIIKLKLWQNTEWWYWTGHTQTDNSERFFFLLFFWCDSISWDSFSMNVVEDVWTILGDNISNQHLSNHVMYSSFLWRRERLCGHCLSFVRTFFF